MADPQAARALARRLRRAEARLDAAVTAVADLAAALPEAGRRQELGLGAGQPVLEATASALALLTESRGRLARAHRRLAGLARTLDLPPMDIGPLDKPGEDTPRPRGVIRPLRRPAA